MIERSLRIEKSRSESESRIDAEELSRACVNLKISNLIVLKADKIVALRYDVTRVCMKRSLLSRLHLSELREEQCAFDADADSLISTSQRTCDVDHSRSDEVLIEDLKVDDEVSQSTISECRLRLLDV